jgi:hypothetical protein
MIRAGFGAGAGDGPAGVDAVLPTARGRGSAGTGAPLAGGRVTRLR